MKTIKGFPPNFDQIDKAFGVKDAPDIVYTYGNTLYVPSGKTIDKPLMRHEETHAKQQSATSPAEWWDRYIADPEFRMAQELEAYRRQYAAMFDLPSAKRTEYLNHIAKDLSGYMYGNLMSADEAKALIVNNIDMPLRRNSTKEARQLKKRARQNRRKARVR